MVPAPAQVYGSPSHFNGPRFSPIYSLSASPREFRVRMEETGASLDVSDLWATVAEASPEVASLSIHGTFLLSLSLPI